MRVCCCSVWCWCGSVCMFELCLSMCLISVCVFLCVVCVLSVGHMLLFVRLCLLCVSRLVMGCGVMVGFVWLYVCLFDMCCCCGCVLLLSVCVPDCVLVLVFVFCMFVLCLSYCVVVKHVKVVGSVLLLLWV